MADPQAVSSINVVLPLATLVIGLVAKPLTDWLDARRIREREREARLESRRDQVFERRNSFQRQTLLAMQDKVNELIQLSSTTWENHRAYLVESLKANAPIAPPLGSKDFLASLIQAMILAERVRDDKCRELANKFVETVSNVTSLTAPEDWQRFSDKVYDGFTNLNSGIGKLLRELDDSFVTGIAPADAPRPLPARKRTRSETPESYRENG